MFLQFRRSGWSRVIVASAATAITLAACGGGGDAKTSNVTPASMSSALAPDAVSQAARVQEIKSLTLTAAKDRIATGMVGSTTQMTATALDAMGLPVIGVTIRFSSEGFKFIGDADVVTDAQGNATATITSSGNRMNRSSMVYATPVTSVEGDPSIRAEKSISASGTRIVTPQSAPLHLHGITRIAVKVVDSDGIGIPGTAVDFDMGEGAFLDWMRETDSEGNVWLTVTDPGKSDHTIKVRAGDMTAEFAAPIEQIKPGSLAIRFATMSAVLNTGLDNNALTALVHVQRADESPVANTSITFKASEDGAIASRSATTNANGDATVTITTGSDLSNRTIAVSAEVMGSFGDLQVAVRGTTLTMEVTPMMTILSKPVWKITARDGAGQPIANAPIDLEFSLLSSENSIEFTPIDPSTFGPIAPSAPTPNPKIAQTAQSGSAKRSVRTNVSGSASIEFGMPPDSMVGKVIKASGVYGSGKQTASAKQHVYEGVPAFDANETILSNNLLTETTPYRYAAREWHRLFLILPDDKLYESLNGKGPTARNDKCNAGYSKITVRANGQDIFLRGTKISSQTCSMDWSGDLFGLWGVGRRGFTLSDFRISYVPSDNFALPPGRYIAPLRFSVIESDPDSGNDIYWGNKDVVVFITK